MELPKTDNMKMNFLENNPNLKLLCLLLGAWILFYVCRLYLSRIINLFVSGFTTTWSGIFSNSKLVSLLSWLLPMGIINSGTRMIEGLNAQVLMGIQRITLILLVLISIRAISVTLAKFNEIYNSFELARNRPIKGITQIINILLYSMSLILIIAIILDRSPWFLLSGLGAMTAILLLVFRDTILSLVAGVQLTTNNLIRIGDWIEMPQFAADGDVVDIALHAVRVQNWDKTITVIPTHKFLEHSFKNWRGMQESGGRRIKRSIHIDINTIRFLTEEEIDNFSHFLLLKDYINDKKNELAEYNQGISPDLIVNARRLTNVGTFRAYLTHYLKQHPRINQSMTFIVRQLAPESNGLPIEIYVFVNDVRWVVYEQTQADIFDHVIAIASQFGLRIHQNPTGNDFKTLKFS